MSESFDIAIVGAGLVGSSLALALRDSGFKVALIEASALKQSTPPGFDDRALVLNAASLRILKALNALAGISESCTSVREIKVTRQGEFGSLTLRASEVGVAAFGAVVPARALGEALHREVASCTNVALIDGARVVGVLVDVDSVSLTLARAQQPLTVRARLLVGADGTFSPVRELIGVNYSETDYDSCAIVASIAAERPHLGCAWERFTDQGPIALLPRTAPSMGLVYCVPPDQLDVNMALNEREFLAKIGALSGFPLGRFLRLGTRSSYPLRLVRAEKLTAMRTVLIGNAANTLHPIGGQGFNLGLRDVAVLRDILLDSALGLGIDDALSHYAQSRQADHDATVQFTDILARASSNASLMAQLARASAFAALTLPGAHRHTLMRHAMGFRGPAPTLMRGAA